MASLLLQAFLYFWSPPSLVEVSLDWPSLSSEAILAHSFECLFIDEIQHTGKAYTQYFRCAPCSWSMAHGLVGLWLFTVLVLCVLVGHLVLCWRWILCVSPCYCRLMSLVILWLFADLCADHQLFWPLQICYNVLKINLMCWPMVLLVNVVGF